MTNIKANMLSMATLVIFFGLTCSCKKNSGVNDTASSNLTMAASIKNKNWWGTFSYTNQPVEYYSVEFNEDGSLLWEQYSGEYPGHWSLAGKKLTITFGGIDVEITAEINGDKLTNFSDNTNGSEIISGGKIENPDIAIDNSLWEGSVLPNTVLQIKTLSSNIVEASAPFSKTNDSYIRHSHSGTFRTINIKNLFAIVISDHELVGTYDKHVFRIPKI